MLPVLCASQLGRAGGHGINGRLWALQRWWWLSASCWRGNLGSTAREEGGISWPLSADADFRYDFCLEAGLKAAVRNWKIAGSVRLAPQQFH